MKTAIFAAAHAVTRATRAAFADADYRATFAAALRECYRAAAEDMSADAIAAAVMENDPRAEWDAMTGEAQAVALRRIVVWCMNRDRAECDRMGNYRPNVFAWIQHDDDIDMTANEAYIRMERAFENAENAVADGKRDSMPTLRAVMANAARSAARFIGMNEYKHVRSDRRVMARDYNDAHSTNYLEIDEYGRNRRLTVIDDNDSATGERIAPNPESAAIIRDMIERAAKDDTDRAIIAALAIGMTQAEIAERVGIRQQNVSKRIKGIRERYRADDAAAE